MVCLESPNICQVKCQIVLDLKVKPSRSSYLAFPGSPVLTLNRRQAQNKQLSQLLCQTDMTFSRWISNGDES